MNHKKQERQRRARRGREQMKKCATLRLSVFKSGRHIYAQVMSVDNGEVQASASTLEAAVRSAPEQSKMKLARVVGEKVAERAIAKGLTEIAFDRSGYKYHGHVKEVAEGARSGGLKF
ncbi:MAG: 50S ribosomal protein L18 [Gammaproteobacteria bacterium]